MIWVHRSINVNFLLAGKNYIDENHLSTKTRRLLADLLKSVNFFPVKAFTPITKSKYGFMKK